MPRKESATPEPNAEEGVRPPTPLDSELEAARTRELERLWLYMELARSPALMRMLLQVGEWNSDNPDDARKTVEELFAFQAYEHRWVTIRPTAGEQALGKQSKRNASQRLALGNAIDRAYEHDVARSAWLEGLVKRFPRPVDVLAYALDLRAGDPDPLWVKDPEDGDVLVFEWVSAVLAAAEPDHDRRSSALREQVSDVASSAYDKHIESLKRKKVEVPTPPEHVKLVAGAILGVSRETISTSLRWAAERERARANRGPVPFDEDDIKYMRPLIESIRREYRDLHELFDPRTPDDEVIAPPNAEIDESEK